MVPLYIRDATKISSHPITPGLAKHPAQSDWGQFSSLHAGKMTYNLKDFAKAGEHFRISVLRPGDLLKKVEP